MKRMKKTLQLFAVTGSLFFLAVFPLQSQVTIGAGIEPVRAALLDLKDNDPDGDNVTSKTEGLVLVRVKLKHMKSTLVQRMITQPTCSVIGFLPLLRVASL